MSKLPSLIGDHHLAGMEVLAKSSPPGALLEVGVYKGGSASVLYEVAQLQNRSLWLYDTFSGIPYADDVDSHKVGDFSDGMSLESAKLAFPLARVQECVFPGGVEMPDSIAFAHLDVDQYRSYRDSLDVLMPRMVRGGIILCDDYCLGGAAKAIDETAGDKNFLEDGRIFFRC